MLSTMMDSQLTIPTVLWRAERLYASTALVTQKPEGPPERSTYGEMAARARKLASALAKQGIKPGDRVATFAWNTQRHLECYFAIPCMGAVLHTLNVRLFDDQLEYIINHAEDQIIFCDRSVLPTLERLAGLLPTVRLIVLMNDGPESTGVLPNTVDFEAFLATGNDSFDWPEIDEHSAAAMCYTSGTTGNPKGVVYSHRSNLIHSLVAAQPNNMDMSEHDIIMFAVPMFHANSWGIPYTAAMVGASQVFSDRYLDPERVTNLVDSENVTISAGVPTVWIGVLNLLEKSGRRLPHLKAVLCGGSAAPPTLIDGLRRHGITLLHAWGMTETSPLGSVGRPRQGTKPEDEIDQRLSQGRVGPGVEIRIMDPATDEVLPWDGVAFGEIQVRGPWIARGYHNGYDAGKLTEDGWFRTGDVAKITADGYIQIVDRTKDVIKSGGEWISSVDLENAIMAHPKILEAAVIGLAHPKWDERPVAFAVAKPEFKGQVTQEEVIDFLKDKVAKWWLPDEVRFIDEVPKTSVGKFDKKVLRAGAVPIHQGATPGARN
jgi:fatty-acyl-CoA synthase